MLDKLKNATSLSDLAALLGYRPAALSYLLYKVPVASMYATFEIPKKSGGTRKIDAPHPRMRSLQKRLANLLTDCRLEIDQAKPQQKPLSHGFRKSHSIVTNAIPHKKKRFVLNLDLEDFFPSFNFGRVRGFFIKNRDFELHPAVATVIAQIACYKNALPQGSPCSPIISDLIGHVLDVRLVQLARKHSCTYTRYADDLTFSTRQKVFPKQIAAQSMINSEWRLGEEIKEAINGCGFRINYKKTRMHSHTGRQAVTGLTVNQKVNIHANYYRFARAMCHRLFLTGTYFKLSSAKTIIRKRRFRSRNLFFRFFRWALKIFPTARRFTLANKAKRRFVGPLNSLDKLEGILNHIYYVKNQAERRARLSQRKPGKEKSSIDLLYKKFLFFKLFVALKRPLIITEGTTDNVYLRVALRALAPQFPNLFASSSKKTKTQLQLFNHNSSVKHLLELSGGSSEQAALIRSYERSSKIYRFRPLAFPVIIFIDNDNGADEVFKAIKQTYGMSIEHSTDKDFYHLGQNLYLIKTEATTTEKNFHSCIEDYFDPILLKTELNGRKFNPHKEHDAPGEYGKTAFAKNVIAANASSIDFSKFSTIFDRISKVLVHYDAVLASNTP